MTWVIRAKGSFNLGGLKFAVIRGGDGRTRTWVVGGEYDDSDLDTPFAKALVYELAADSPCLTEEGCKTIRIVQGGE